jgi:hypothetical protein
MKSFSLVSATLMMTLAFISCHKTHNDSSPAHIKDIIKSHSWTGYSSQQLASPVGTGNFGINAYYYSVADTTFTLTETQAQMVSVPFFSEPLKYKSTDLTAQTVTYDSLMGGTTAILVYYYAVDSMYCSYSNVAASEYAYVDPYIQHIYYHTHK